jgi:hypothetical protein
MNHPTITIDSLCDHLRTKLEVPGIVEEIERIRTARTSKAGDSREGILNKEFLCPAIAVFFFEVHRDSLALSDLEIESGLGTEGSDNVPNFAFTPKLDRDYFFEKKDVLGKSPPDGWIDPERLRNYRSYADFAIRNPLPLSVVGELKFERKAKTRKGALGAIYEITRQCVFYLAAFGKENGNSFRRQGRRVRWLGIRRFRKSVLSAAGHRFWR